MALVPPQKLDPVAERDPVVQRLLAAARALIRVGYFSFEVEGIEHVPREGRVVYALNHAGWFPMDAFFLTYAIAEAHGLSRAPFFATLDVAMAAPGLSAFLRKFGAVPASWFRRPDRLPPSVESVGMFPEGVRGNTKPFWEAYRMRDWNRGFARVAIARQAPIVPTAILGGEECLPVAWTVKILQPIIGSTLGLPLSLVPLPAHWKIIFHPPVRLDVPPSAVGNHAYCSGVARDLQAVVQATLDREAAQRPLGRFSAKVAEREREVAAAAAARRKGEGEGGGEDPLA
jgi:1-acyl-sn-glycerol-3-phosphate acyltransferase